MQIYSYYMHTAEVQPNLFNQVLYLTLYIVMYMLLRWHIFKISLGMYKRSQLLLDGLYQMLLYVRHSINAQLW